MDEIVDQLEWFPVVNDCYQTWREFQCQIEDFYSEKERQRPPLSEQKEFRSIKNAAIHEVENIRLGQITFENKDAEATAAQGNSHAQFFLNRGDNLKPPSVMLAATRLLYHMSRVFQDQKPSPPVHSGIQVDRKLMARIREKKIAMGHKPDDHEEASQAQTISMG